MPVDVMSEIVIARSPDAVAAYCANPDNSPKWYANIKSIEWKTSPPLAIGSRIAFAAEFLGRHISYVYEIVEFAPGRRLVMRTDQGPFPMETTYTWEPAGEGKTRMSLRNRGNPSGFSLLAMPIMTMAMKKANRKDLERLRSLIEGIAATT
jgi:uncharacterized membrane protein